METQSVAYFDQQVVQEMGKHLQAPAWSVKQKLALTCQMLAAEGHESGLAGQISARAEQPGSFWTFKFGLGLDEATEDTLIRVDDDLGTLEGEGIPNPATRFHLWVYRTRPDVHCIVHKQLLRSSRRNVSPVKLIDGPFLMGHEDLSGALIECREIAKTSSRTNGVLHHAPEAFDRIEMVATVGR